MYVGGNRDAPCLGIFFFISMQFSKKKCSQRRMHSSRMRIARLLTVSQHALLGGGCVPARGMYLPLACTRGGVYLPGGYLPRYSPPVNRMTDRCKNITLPQTSFAGGNNRLAPSHLGLALPDHRLGNAGSAT